MNGLIALMKWALMKWALMKWALVWLTIVPLGWTQEDPKISFETRTLRLREGLEYTGDVGHFEVLENRQSSQSATLKLAFGRLKSTGGAEAPPLFFLPGGPGNPAMPMARSEIWGDFLELGDVVLMDPRGVGQSDPEMSWSSEMIDSTRLFLDRDSAIAHMRECCVAAASDMNKRGVDLKGYTTIEMADDIAQLAKALGYDKINLMGFSFGTHLGLAIVRRYPTLVNRFVSVGTAGTYEMQKLPGDLDRSLAQLSELVASDPVVGDEMPDLFQSLADVVEYLGEEPLLVPIRDPKTGQRRTVPLGAFGLQLLLVADLGDTSDLCVFPRLIRSLEDGDPSLVSWFLTKRVNQFSSLPLMMLSVRAASGATAERWRRISAEAQESPFGRSRSLFSPECDEALGVRDVGDDFRQPVSSEVPTLFVSGTLDAHTPPEQGERVRLGFKNSGHVLVEYAGHEDLMRDREVQRLIRRFLAGAQPVDETLEREPIRFAPLEGPAPGFDHPALQEGR